jgi:hypothetical protein
MAGSLVISTLNNDTGVLATQNGMTGIAKAWVNFAGSTGTINGTSFNVSSVTRSSTGNYIVNFTTAMPNANYAVAGSCGSGGSVAGILFANYQLAPTTTACTIITLSFAGAVTDYTYTSLTVFSS